MGEYKGYGIRFDFACLSSTVSEVAYSVRKGGTVIHEGMLPGSFESIREAYEAIENAARQWIDQARK